MKYKVINDTIEVYSKEEFNPQHILECGQVFCFHKEGEKYLLYPQNQYAEIWEESEKYVISTKNPQYFVKYLALDQNYQQIKEELSKFEIMQNPLKFGYGIRILKQNLFETLISFIISANNNIKRITLILNNLRRELGEKNGEIYSFPSHDALKNCDKEFFKRMGAGYRADYLVKVCKQITPEILQEYDKLPTTQLRNKLIELAGVGPKVADCVLLFGYNRGDVFPVDTWIEKMYNQYFPIECNREKIRNNLVAMFGKLSGQAQQYLFYYQRSGEWQKR